MFDTCCRSGTAKRKTLPHSSHSASGQFIERFSGVFCRCFCRSWWWQRLSAPQLSSCLPCTDRELLLSLLLIRVLLMLSFSHSTPTDRFGRLVKKDLISFSSSFHLPFHSPRLSSATRLFSRSTARERKPVLRQKVRDILPIDDMTLSSYATFWHKIATTASLAVAVNHASFFH